jgi:two-component system, NtrC family, nitrogen regulation sensor histidine kinase NtrY
MQPSEPLRPGPPQAEGGLLAQVPGARIGDLAGSTPVQAAAYVLSVALTFVALFFAVSGPELVNPASIWIGVLLLVNLGLIVYLGVVVWRRVAVLLAARREVAAGARLHMRLVARFAIAAGIPAIVIAVFSALTIGRGVQAWFSEQVRGAVEATAVFGREEIKRSSDAVAADIVAMARDLDAAAPQLQTSPGAFRQYMAAQADRRGFVAAYLMTGGGTIILQAERPGGVPPRVSPMQEDFATANDGTVAYGLDENAVVRALFRLDRIPDTYLRVVRLPEPGQAELLRQADGAVQAYRLIEERQGALMVLFALAYLETVLLVIIGAAWLGLVSAQRIAVPIGGLAAAAERVRSGDLSVRVEPDPKVEEIAALSTTFNAMTAELSTQRSALEDAREQAEARSAFIRTVLEGVSAGVVSLDADGKVRAANGSAARLLQVEPGELEQLGLAAAAPEFADIISRAREGMAAAGQVEHKVGADTRSFDVRAAFAGGELVVTFDDVSSLLSAQRQAAWKDVARRIAHEIKNPLTPIQLSAERLRRKYADQIDGDRDTFIRMTDTIVRQVADIGRMVDEFSAFARMPAPRIAVEDLGEVLRQRVFAQRIASPDIDVHAGTPPEPVLMAMDSRLLGQAFANILKNAAESIAQRRTTSGEALCPGVITATMDLSAASTLIEVTDTGIGFPAENRSRLLEPYMTTRAKGTGLGLAIVARIIEEHGGTLELADRSDGQRGASVRIRLPRGTASGTGPITETLQLESTAHGS